MPDPGSASPDRAIDVLTAEFSALRAEIVARMTKQAAILGAGLTAIGVIAGLALQKDGDERLLLGVPVLAALINVLYAADGYRAAKMGEYMRVELWPQLRSLTGGSLTCWEDTVAGWRRSYWPPRFLLDVLEPTVFVLAGLWAIVQAEEADVTVRAAAWVALAIAAVAPVILGILVGRSGRVNPPDPPATPAKAQAPRRTA